MTTKPDNQTSLGKLLVDEAFAELLAEETGLSTIQIMESLGGEKKRLAIGIVSWIIDEEGKIVEKYGLLEGRRRYRPAAMLRNWARKNGYGAFRKESA